MTKLRNVATRVACTAVGECTDCRVETYRSDAGQAFQMKGERTMGVNSRPTMGKSAGPADSSIGAGITSKYLTFFLDEEEYGLEILKVQEIIGLLPITKVPRTDSYVRGVINLRGRVIPTVDLRMKFGMEPKEATEETCIVVVQVSGTQIGVIVDRVSEVLDIDETDVENAPSLGSDAEADYLLGIANAGGRVRLLLDIERVLSDREIVNLHSVQAAEEQLQ